MSALLWFCGGILFAVTVYGLEAWLGSRQSDGPECGLGGNAAYGGTGTRNGMYL